MIRASIVGTTIAWVTTCCRTVSSQPSGVNGSSVTRRRPEYTLVSTLEIAEM